MLKSIKRTIGSGGVKYDVTIGFEGMNAEQIQQDATSYYVWKLQRQIRDASDAQREAWASAGITIHATEVGKSVVTTEELVGKMTDEQAEKAYKLLEAKLKAK